MGSIIGLLAVLLVLPGCSLASITYEKVIACAVRYPHVDAYSTEFIP
uniref:Col_cuticle_N domain-containing protein n=1 Tax=Steinernema glaseri TaxID=37863 RepID=A0A1I8AP59_9BILA